MGDGIGAPGGRFPLQSLISKQNVFSTALKIVLNEAGADDCSRLHFKLHPRQYEVAFEAIRHPGKELPWMLRAPMIRSLSDGSGMLLRRSCNRASCDHTTA